jgi:hypothetical protein
VARQKGRSVRYRKRERRAAERAEARGDLVEPFRSGRRLRQYRLLHPSATVRYEGKDYPIGLAHMRGICGGRAAGCEECERLAESGTSKRNADGTYKPSARVERETETMTEEARAEQKRASEMVQAEEARRREALRGWKRDWATAQEQRGRRSRGLG